MKTKAHNNKAGGTVTAEVNDFWWQFFGYYQEKQILISMTKVQSCFPQETAVLFPLVGVFGAVEIWTKNFCTSLFHSRMNA